MQRLTWIIDQIDLSKQLIQKPNICNYRSAIILLDNAAEILLYRRVQDEVEINEIYEQMLSKAKRELSPDKFLELCNKVDFPAILTQGRKRKIERNFHEKLILLVEKGELRQPFARALSGLHTYRNETFHQDVIREELLHSMAVLLFDLDCELLQSFRHGLSYSSSDDWNEFFKRYHVQPKTLQMLDDDGIAKIIAGWRADIQINIDSLRENLRTYTNARIVQTNKQLAWVKDMLGIPSREDALKFVDSEFREKNHELLQIEVLDAFSDRILAATKYKDKCDLFNGFVGIEQEFKPYETSVQKAHSSIDRAIQFQIDLARGK